MKNKWLKMIIAVAAILSVLGATLVLAEPGTQTTLWLQRAI